MPSQPFVIHVIALNDADALPEIDAEDVTLRQETSSLLQKTAGAGLDALARQFQRLKDSSSDMRDSACSTHD